MAFALKPGKSIRRGLKRAARKELGRAWPPLLQDPSDDAVHEGRKSVKKVEAVVTLLEQTGFTLPRKDAKRLHAARAALSALRDADVMIETFDRLRTRFRGRIPEHTSAIIRAHLARAKSKIATGAWSDGSLARAANKLRKTRRSAKRWRLSPIERSDLPALFKDSYRASRKAMTRAQRQGRPLRFHEWRKCVKNLWYQLRLAQPLVSDLTAEISAFKKLETQLGEEHNLFVLRTRLARDRSLRHIRGQINNLTAMSTALQDERRRSALALGTRLHASSPKQFAKDLRRRLKPRGTRPRQPASRHRAHAAA